MKFVLLAISCFLSSVVASSIDEQWTSFKKEHNKKYSNAREESTRFSIFKENAKEIEEHNAKYASGDVTYTLRMNQFGDMSLKEFTTKFTGYKISPPKNTSSLFRKFTYSSDVNLPDSIDWREKGAVTPVKNQGQCNGCWSFSATGAMEGQLFRSTGNLVSLSEQQLIDCSREYGNLGCNGGLMDETFKYIKDVGGVMSEDSYPFLGWDALCNFAPKSVVNGSKVVSYNNLPPGDEQALKEALANVGPVSVAVAAANQKFMFYEGGILTNQGCGLDLDHAVLVVGYGTSKVANEDYWIVKNSWSPKWGEKGYVKIARNRGNTCGLATFPVYPVLEDSKNSDKSTTAPAPTSLTPVTIPIPVSTTPSGAWKAVLSSGYLLIASSCFVYFSLKL